VPTAASLAQAKSAKSSHATAVEREEPSATEATSGGEDDAATTAATKAKRNDNTKEAREERYAAVLRRVKEREARLAAAGSPEVQKEAFLLKSLPQLNLVLRSYDPSFVHRYRHFVYMSVTNTTSLSSGTFKTVCGQEVQAHSARRGADPALLVLSGRLWVVFGEAYVSFSMLVGPLIAHHHVIAFFLMIIRS
jgi:phosphatidylethanolamine-binding protein (PEBP) family uncharacterized protein